MSINTDQIIMAIVAEEIREQRWLPGKDNEVEGIRSLKKLFDLYVKQDATGDTNRSVKVAKRAATLYLRDIVTDFSVEIEEILQIPLPAVIEKVKRKAEELTRSSQPGSSSHPNFNRWRSEYEAGVTSTWPGPVPPPQPRSNDTSRYARWDSEYYH